MNMQDNELDDLFRSKLGNLEVEPSAHIWNNIATELGGNKKRTMLPALRIAASIIIILGIGAWFTLRQPATVEHNQVAVKPVKATGQATQKNIQQTVAPVVTEQTPDLQIAAQPVNQMARVVKRTTAKAQVTPTVQKEQVTVVVTPAPEQSAQVLAALPKMPAVAHPVVPEMNLTTPTEQRAIADAKPIAASTPQNILAQQPEKKKKRGIHSLGGLINAVMAKVDKREDKLIEFTETDEEDSITGINLGLIKVKKEK